MSLDPTGIVTALSNLFGSVREIFGFASQKDAEKNTPAMVQSVEARREAAAMDKTRAAISAGDAKEIRRELAE